MTKIKRNVGFDRLQKKNNYKFLERINETLGVHVLDITKVMLEMPRCINKKISILLCTISYKISRNEIKAQHKTKY